MTERSNFSRSIFVLWTCAVLAACAASTPLPPEARIKGNILDGATFTFPMNPGSDFVSRAQRCAVLELGQDDVLLRSAWPGVLAISGSAAVELVDKDVGLVVARGAGSYSVAGGLTSRTVRFKMLIEMANDELRLTTTGARQAQLATGYSPVTGFREVGTWAGSGGADAFAVMENASRRVHSCMTGR